MTGNARICGRSRTSEHGGAVQVRHDPRHRPVLGRRSRDHANGLATLAAGGLRATAHFVQKVVKGKTTYYVETLPTNQAASVQPAEQQRPHLRVEPGRLGQDQHRVGHRRQDRNLGVQPAEQAENAHAWMVGYSKKLAAGGLGRQQGRRAGSARQGEQHRVRLGVRRPRYGRSS